MRRMRSNVLRTVLAAAVPVGLVLSAAVVWQSTSAAFTATASNEGNQWQAGTVSFRDKTIPALFSVGSPGPDGLLRPDSKRSQCIQVAYTGNLDANVKLYVTTPTTGGTTGATTLDQYLVMSIEKGRDLDTATAPPVTPECTNFDSTTGAPTFMYNNATAGSGAQQTKTMSDLKTTRGSYQNGIPVAAGVKKGTSLTFKISYWVQDHNEAQGTQSDAAFIWQAENTTS